ncbi:MAG: dihydroorotase family protein, partial [Thaumarchaeota archaeon]|nr:dihydroorotase family protein [Nitrososphaerota archaeon]
DAHVHFRDPGPSKKEDFASGSQAAAAGGVTCVLDMPNNEPPTRDAKTFKAKAEIAGSKAVVDFGLFGLLSVDSLKDIDGLVSSGAIGFKCYMGTTTGSIPPPSDGEMLAQFSRVASSGRRVAVHAENESIVRYLAEELRREGRVYPRAHYESRPAVAEEEAVSRALILARSASCLLHIAHLSSAAGVEVLRRAKRKGSPVTVETCPHYLLLDEGSYPELESRMKINPAIKSATDRAALWEALRDGTVDMIATDHSPHTIEEKGTHDIFEAPSGFPGLETAVPLMLTEVSKGNLSLERYVELTSANPARAWGLFPRKGSIEVGSEADITIVDLKARSKIDPSKFHSKAKWSPFEGVEVEGAPVYTISRGRVVMDRGVVDTTPVGRMVMPNP